jgi:pimeloyl-[acyl-carrier protein] methyl ester esterase
MTLAHEWHEGPADAPALVLLHGWGLHSGVWQDFLPLLRKDFRVLCIDLPGFGKNASCSAASVSEAVDALLVVAPEKAVWLGWSLGGLLALELASRHPQRVQALVMMAATPCFLQRPDWPTAMALSDFRQFRAAVEEDAVVALLHFLGLQCKGSVSMKEDLRFLKSVVKEADTPALPVLRAGLDWLEAVDARASLSRLDIPVDFLLGRHDALLPATLAQALSPAFSCTVVDGAAHLPFVSHPHACVAALHDFCCRAGVLA